MSSINWSLLLIIAMVLMVIFVMGAMVIFYLRHWAARYTPPQQVGEGQYFKQYILDDIKTELQLLSDLLLKKKKKSLQRIKHTFTFFIVSFLIITVGTGLYINRDKLASRIDLSAKEANNLITIKHDWTHQYPEKIPILSTELTPLKQHGIVLVVDKTPEAHNAWSRFAKNNKITLTSCNWKDIDQCKQTYQDWLFVVLPSYWRRPQLERMFEQGLSVILYDAPTQVASLNKHSQYSLYGMQFRRFTDNSYSKLALVGDQELSLGFDAGSIIDVNRLSRHYTVHSLYPQAVAIDSANRSGGTLLTRLYAQTVAKGRFVWMDFSPNTGDHAHELEQKKFEGVIASIFRYLSKKPYQAIAMWPEGKRFAALLEEDTEDKFHYADRVHRFFIENNYPITWYILSNEAQINRALTRDLAVSGEVACHGDNHRPFTLSDMQEQHKRIARCQKVLFELTGKKVASFRPPEEKFVDETLDAMTNNDITHFIAQYGVDRFVPIIMTSTVTGKQLVSLPRMVADDFELWHRLKMKSQVSKKLTLQEINYVEALSGLYIFSFHTQFMGDDDNFSVVKDIAHHIHKKDAYFQTTSMISEWWKVRTRLTAGKAIKAEEIRLFKPVLLRVNAKGKLVSLAYTNLRTAKK